MLVGKTQKKVYFIKYFQIQQKDISEYSFVGLEFHIRRSGSLSLMQGAPVAAHTRAVRFLFRYKIICDFKPFTLNQERGNSLY